MVHKILDLYPKLTYLSEDKLDLSNFTAVAIPVLQGEKIELLKTRFLTTDSNFTKLDINIEYIIGQSSQLNQVRSLKFQYQLVH